MFILGFKSVSLSTPQIGSSHSTGTTQATVKKGSIRNGGPGGALRPKDDECFGDAAEQDLNTDFDFEGNLALFDKAAVFSQIEASVRHGSRTQYRSKSEQRPATYQHHENILEGKPLVSKQTTVLQHGGKEFCTGELGMLAHARTHTHTVTKGYWLSFVSLVMV